MAGKVKVSYEVAEGLKRLFASNKKDYSNDEILRLHYRAKHCGELWSGDRWSHLNILTLSEMSQALFVGYEIEETPEEKILMKFNDVLNSSCNLTETDYQRWNGQGFVNGIIFVLSELNIKIKGINE